MTWEQPTVVAPANMAFSRADMKTLIIANLCGWTVNTASVAAPGLGLRYPL